MPNPLDRLKRTADAVKSAAPDAVAQPAAQKAKARDKSAHCMLGVVKERKKSSLTTPMHAVLFNCLMFAGMLWSDCCCKAESLFR